MDSAQSLAVNVCHGKGAVGCIRLSCTRGRSAAECPSVCVWTRACSGLRAEQESGFYSVYACSFVD